MNRIDLFMRGGNIRSQIKQLELQKKLQAPIKKEEEKSPKQKEIDQMREDMARLRDGNKMGALDVKLKSGELLTEEELQYLKEKNPELYKEAIEIKKERQIYEKELKESKSKEDVERIYQKKTHQFMSQIKSIQANPNIPAGKKKDLIEKLTKKFQNMQTIHTKFMDSRNYQELPKTDHEKRAKKTPVETSERLEALLELSMIGTKSFTPAAKAVHAYSRIADTSNLE